jgi:Phage tail assembly chaperone protein
VKRGQRVVWELPDGTICVGKFLGGDPAAFLARVQADPALAGAQRLADPADADPLPERRWRDCWRHRGDGQVHVDMALARARRLAEIRAERDLRLAASDGPMLREQEAGPPERQQALRAYRQALRELPNDLERSGALEALAGPAELAGFAPAWPAAPFAL